MYGPPGTGKSYLAKACATEAAGTFFSITASDLMSKWQGESEKTVRALFEMARAKAPSIIFLDEVDSLCGSRGESGESDSARRIKTEFLTQMDGVGKNKDNLLVLGATNTPWDLDSAIRRRFEKRIYIPLPDADGRLHMLKIHLGDTPHALSHADLAAIAEKAENFSGADMQILCREALYGPVRRCTRAKFFKRVAKVGKDGVSREYWTPCSPGAAGGVEMAMMSIVDGKELLPPEVSLDDFENAMEQVRPSVCLDDLVEHEKFTREFGMQA